MESDDISRLSPTSRTEIAATLQEVLHRVENEKAAVMNSRFLALCATVALPMMCARADETVSDADRAFVGMVSQGGMFEVKVGELAAEQGSTQDIKDQGNTEAHDHKLVGDKLKSIASSNGIQIAESLNADFQKELDALKRLSGVAFDSAYLRDMEAIHAKDGAAFAKEAKSGSNQSLREFADRDPPHRRASHRRIASIRGEALLSLGGHCRPLAKRHVAILTR